jgi:hypothetical protein
MTSTPPECLRFVGLCLSGTKSTKSSLAILEYYHQQDKVILSHIFDKISVLDQVSSDDLILKSLNSLDNLVSVFVNAPLQVPKCMRCKLKCPGYDICEEPEIEWMRNFYEAESEQKKPHKVLSPYTERCSELYWKNNLEDETFILDHAGGANKASIMFRAMYLNRSFKTNPMNNILKNNKNQKLSNSKNSLEVNWQQFYPQLSVWQWGRSLKVAKSHLRHYSHSVYGKEAREIFLSSLAKKTSLFFYDVEAKKIVNDKHSFDALLGALTAFSYFNKEYFKRPKDFPKGEAWPIIPT